MKEILIRNLDSSVVDKLDILVKKKNLSRNEYLVSYLNYISEIDTLFLAFDRYETLLKKVEYSLIESKKTIERVGNL
ncbi:hypothetical protein [Faecalimicrobium sp. JNUCC 81]